MDISIYNFVLEVTRRCNMACPHCMRGEAENCDITPEIIDAALEGVTNIDSIVFTGGEPTLNIPAIEYTLQAVKARGIYVGSFYIVTNGKVITEEFLNACIRWYAYCYSCDSECCKELSGVAISKDVFHEDIPEENEGLLRALSFFDGESKKTDWSKAYLYNKGRAKNLTSFKKRPDGWTDSIDVERTDDGYVVSEGALTITANGEVMPFCDYSFEEVKDVSIGTVFEDYATILDRFIAKQEAEDEEDI